MLFLIIFLAVLLTGVALVFITGIRSTAKSLPAPEGIASAELVDYFKYMDTRKPQLEFPDIATCQEVVADRGLREALLAKERMWECLNVSFTWGPSGGQGRYSIVFDAATEPRRRLESADKVATRRSVGAFMRDAPATPRRLIPAPTQGENDVLLRPSYASALSSFLHAFRVEIDQRQCTNYVVMAPNNSCPYVSVQALNSRTGFESYHLLWRTEQDAYVYFHAHNDQGKA